MTQAHRTHHIAVDELTVALTRKAASSASSRDLLSRFHTAARDPRLPLADAPRQAILDICDRAGYDHLYHWGGFTLVGSWR
jgi:CHAT domain-containing protein